MVPSTSSSTSVYIDCIVSLGNSNPYWAVDLSQDAVSTYLQFNTRGRQLNSFGVYKLPPEETDPGKLRTLRLLVNDTTRNNGTRVFCEGQGHQRYLETMLVLYGKHDNYPCT